MQLSLKTKPHIYWCYLTLILHFKIQYKISEHWKQWGLVQYSYTIHPVDVVGPSLQTSGINCPASRPDFWFSWATLDLTILAKVLRCICDQTEQVCTRKWNSSVSHLAYIITASGIRVQLPKQASGPALLTQTYSASAPLCPLCFSSCLSVPGWRSSACLGRFLYNRSKLQITFCLPQAGEMTECCRLSPSRTSFQATCSQLQYLL